MDGWVDGQFKHSSTEKRSKGVRIRRETVKNDVNFETFVAHANVCTDTLTCTHTRTHTKTKTNEHCHVVIFTNNEHACPRITHTQAKIH